INTDQAVFYQGVCFPSGTYTRIGDIFVQADFIIRLVFLELLLEFLQVIIRLWTSLILCEIFALSKKLFGSSSFTLYLCPDCFIYRLLVSSYSSFHRFKFSSCFRGGV